MSDKKKMSRKNRRHNKGKLEVLENKGSGIPEWVRNKIKHAEKIKDDRSSRIKQARADILAKQEGYDSAIKDYVKECQEAFVKFQTEQADLINKLTREMYEAEGVIRLLGSDDEDEDEKDYSEDE